VNVTEKIRGFFATKKEKHSKADLAPIIWWKVTKRWERSYVLVTGQQCANIQWMRDELTILGFWYITVRWWLNLETGGVAVRPCWSPQSEILLRLAPRGLCFLRTVSAPGIEQTPH